MTSACCCGTTRIALMTTMTATTNSASVTIEDPISMYPSVKIESCACGAVVRKDQHRPAQRGDVHGLDLRRIGRGEFGVPSAAPIGNTRRPVGAPADHLYLRADVERLLLRRFSGEIPLPALQPNGSDHSKHAGDQPLQRHRGGKQRCQPPACHREPDDEQIKCSSQQFDRDQRGGGDPPDPVSSHRSSPRMRTRITSIRRPWAARGAPRHSGIFSSETLQDADAVGYSSIILLHNSNTKWRNVSL